MPRLSLYLLGPPRIEGDGVPIDVDTRKATALLVYLALNRERHRRAALVNLLWPELDERRGRAALRRTLSTLRKAIDVPLLPLTPRGQQSSWLETDYESVELRRNRPDGLFWVDVDDFHDLLAQCRSHGHPETEVCPACLPLLTDAAALYRGDFLSGFTLRDSVNFDDWQFYQTDALRRAFASALARLARGQSAQGAYEPALRAARRWLDLDRLDEAAHVQLMRLYARTGQRSAALRQYEECVQVLDEQLGASPQAATTALYEEILSGRPSQSGPPSSQKVDVEPAPHALPPPQAMPSAGGEKRVITVLCADVSASFHRSGAISPEAEAELVERFLGVVEAALSAFGDQRARILGGRAIVTFGLEQTHESDAERALRAALEIRQRSMKEGLQVRIGVNSGEIYARELTPDTVVGSVFEQAVRLAEGGALGQVRVGEVTYQLARRLFEWGTAVEGEGPVYCLERLLARPRTALEFDGLRPPLIGRHEQWTGLQAALDRVRQGHGQMVSLIGEAGVGKSRLIAELRDRALAADEDEPKLLWLQGRCLDLGTTAPYAPFIDLFAQYFSWSDQDDDGVRCARIVSALHALSERPSRPKGPSRSTGPALDRSRSDEIGALLCHLLLLQPVGIWAAVPPDEPPEQIRYRTFLAIRDLFLALSRQQPLVLVFDDLHWADDLSLDLISLLMESVAQAPLFLLCAYRPEREHRSMHLGAIAARKCGDAYSELHLRELSGAQSERLLAALLHSDPFPSSLRDAVLARAQGNPFFIEEALRALTDAEVVYRDAGRWRVREGEDLEWVPKTVQSVVLSRVDRLSPALKDVLQTASVIGSVFGRRVLAHTLQQADELGRRLWALEEAALIYPERTLPQVEYRFRHDLAQEAIYANLPRRRREILHERVALALESLHSANVDEVCEQVAFHYDRGGLEERAIPYLLRAGLKARNNSANEAAIAHLRRGLELLQTQPESADRDQLELELLLTLGVPLVLTRGHGTPEVEATYARAHVLCAQGCDPPDHFQIVLGLRRVHFMRRELKTARLLGAELLDIANEIDDPTYPARAHMMQGEVLYWMGAFDAALAHCIKGRDTQNGDPRQQRAARFRYGNDTQVGCGMYAAMAQWHLGYPDQAAARVREMLDLAESLDHPFTLVFALRFAIQLYQCLRDTHKALVHSNRMIELAAEQGFALFEAWGRITCGWALAAQGQTEAGLAAMEEGLSALQRTGTGLALPYAWAWQAEALAKAGRVEQGLCTVEQALALAATSEERCWQAEMHRLQGELLLMSNRDMDEAEACFRRALEVAREQGARSWELRAATSLGQLLHRQGKTKEARTLVQGIYDWFSEGFNTTDLREAEALLESWADRRNVR
jgi:DNA-binding SARP family transcriptional activator/predicted ATPase/class 3 adenylate cyclase